MFETQNKKENLIKQLVAIFKNYIHGINDLSKIKSIFDEFDEKAHSDFQKLIVLSNQRLKSIKSGNSIDCILKKQKTNYINMLDMILNDRFYVNPEITEERKKLNRMYSTLNDFEKNKEIKQIRDKIVYRAKTANREFSDVSSRLFAHLNSDTYRNKIQNSKLYLKVKQKKSKERIKMKSANSKVQKIDKLKLDRELQHKEYTSLLEKDQNLFLTQLANYKQHLDDIKKDLDQNGLSDIAKGQKKHKIPSNLFNLMNYQTIQSAKEESNKRDTDAVSLQKLIKYTRNKQSRQHIRSIPKSAVNTDKKLQMIEEIMSKQNDSSTMNLVKREIISANNIDKKFLEKRQNLESLIDIELPSIGEVEQKVKKKFQNLKHDDNMMNERNTIEEDNEDDDAIKKEYIDNYDKKKKMWMADDIKRAKEELDEKLKRRENKKIIQEIKKRSRYANLFVDQYSLREERVNKNILDLNHELGKNVYDKKKLNKKIDEFILNLEKTNEEEIGSANKSKLSNKAKTHNNFFPMGKAKSKEEKYKELVSKLDLSPSEYEQYELFLDNQKEFDLEEESDDKNNRNNLSNFEKFLEYKDRIVSKDKRISIVQNKVNRNVKQNKQNPKNFEVMDIRKYNVLNQGADQIINNAEYLKKASSKSTHRDRLLADRKNFIFSNEPKIAFAKTSRKDNIISQLTKEI